MDLQREVYASNSANPSSYVKLQPRADEYLTERHEPPELSLDELGMIQNCSKSFETLFGFQRRDLVWNHISRLFPQLTGVDLVQAGQLNPFLNYLCHCGHLYQAHNRQGDTFPCNLSFVRVEFDGRRFLRLIVNPSAKLES